MLRERGAELRTNISEEVLGKSRPIEEFLDELDRELGIKSDPEARKRKDKIQEAVSEYEMYCFEREVAAVRGLLRTM